MTLQTNENEGSGIRFENRDGYLYTFFSGKRNGLSDAKKYWQCAIDECNKRAYKQLLVEQHFSIPLSTVDTFALAEAISRMPVTHLTVAFVDRDLTQTDMNMFAETVAVNRGGFGRVFVNLTDAKAWLTSQV